MKPPPIGLLVAALCVASCGPAFRPCFADCTAPLPPHYVPDPATTAALVRLAPAQAWTATSITVRDSDRLLFTATGEVTWEAGHLTTGPDGDHGVPGWRVGQGGLQGKIGVTGTPFDLGARTGLFQDTHPRGPHHPYPPPPIRMRENGTLYLGFKDFRAGTNTGTFDVTINRAVAAH